MTQVAGHTAAIRHHLKRGLATAGPLCVAVVAVVVMWLLDVPVADLQAAIARQEAAGSDVGLTYWFGWYGGVSPGSYSVVVPVLSQVTGTLGLLFLASLSVVVAGTALARGTRHPALLRWAVAAAAVSNMLSGRVAFTVGAAFALVAVLAVRGNRHVLAAVLLVVSGLASPLAPAFVGLATLPLWIGGDRSRPVLTTLVGAGAGVVVPSVLFGAPGMQPVWGGHLAWAAVAAAGGYLALRGTAQRWLAPVAMAVAVVLYLVPTSVGSNVNRFFFLVLPCLVLAWTPWRGWRLLLALLPAICWTVYAGVSDQAVAAEEGYSVEEYAPLREALLARPDLTGHRVELLDNPSHAGSHALGPDVLLARGWENQTDARYNDVLIEGGEELDAAGYRAWLLDNAVAYVAVAADPLVNLRTRAELELVESGLPYLTEVWRDGDWTLYRVEDARPIVPAPLELVSASPSQLVVDVPDTEAHPVQVRPNRYLVARSVDDPDTTACLLATDDGWITLQAPAPGTYVLEGDLSLAGVVGADSPSCE